jgi:hypothetical protein
LWGDVLIARRTFCRVKREATVNPPKRQSCAA